ncbi:MAG: hypothetical protein LBL38_01950 [Lactobacillales bacterium]|jgi:hypothetical protein|nr:hypothetical protein [Lactobacillales bacterium]
MNQKKDKNQKTTRKLSRAFKATVLVGLSLAGSIPFFSANYTVSAAANLPKTSEEWVTALKTGRPIGRWVAMFDKDGKNGDYESLLSFAKEVEEGISKAIENHDLEIIKNFWSIKNQLVEIILMIGGFMDNSDPLRNDLLNKEQYFKSMSSYTVGYRTTKGVKSPPIIVIQYKK